MTTLINKNKRNRLQRKWNILTPTMALWHLLQTSEYFLAKHSLHTGFPSRSLNVTAVIGFSQTKHTKCSGCHDLPNAVKVYNKRNYEQRIIIN